MKIWGLNDYHHAEAIALSIGLTTENAKNINKKCVQLRVRPINGRAKYSRCGNSGRRVVACCAHGFRDYIRECFNQGATRIQTAQGDFRSLDQFNSSLNKLFHINIGSVGYPLDMAESCECEVNEDIAS